MVSPGLTDAINDQAAQWAVDSAYGEMTPDSRAALESWLAADSRHRGAYARARASLYMMEDAVTATRSPRSSGRDTLYDTHPRRRRFRWAIPIVAGGAALSASIAAVVAVGVPMITSRPDALKTDQVVNLKDGSVATLRHGARIEFAMADGIRKVTLLGGQATFKVAHDKAHPFVVRSGDVYAQATGTIYSVRRLGLSGGSVTVTEGSVLVWLRDERDQAVLLHAGETAMLDPVPRAPEPARTPASPAPSRLPPPELAQISLDDEPIRVAVARFNRVNSTKIIVADSAIAESSIVGLYRANDPEHFANAAALIAGGIVVHENGNIVIKAK